LAGEKMLFGAQHQHVRFGLGLDAEREVDGHLVAVEVGVEALADQRVDLDGVAFDKHRLERLDAMRCSVGARLSMDRVLVDDLFEDVPHLGVAAFQHLLADLMVSARPCSLSLRMMNGW